MTYFCFIQSSPNGFEHMEPLEAGTVAQATRQARRLLNQHDFAHSAQVFIGDRRVATLQAGNAQRPPSASAGSLMLSSVSPLDREALRHHLRRRRLVMGESLFRAGDWPDHVVIPIDVVLAHRIRLDDGADTLTASIGREGISDLSSLLADTPVAWNVSVQHAGDAWFLPTQVLRRDIERLPHLRRLLLQMAQATTLQISHNVVCAASHDVRSRVARWLLSISDRTGKAQVHIRQEELAGLLGAQRTTINAAAQELHRLGATSNGRGFMTIRDRPLLRSQSCECYSHLSKHPEPRVS